MVGMLGGCCAHPPSETAAWLIPPPGQRVTVAATVADRGATVQPRSVAYRDHLIAVHFVDIGRNRQAAAYLQSMRDNVLTPVAGLGVGDRVTVELRPWADAARFKGTLNRSELPGDGVPVDAPWCWGELVAD